jgi:hypothetical protein
LWALAAEQWTKAVSAIVILVNMMMGGKYQSLMIILFAEMFISMSNGLLKMN